MVKVIHRLLAMISTECRAILCNPCGNWIWIGRCFGFNVRLDVEPLTLEQEIVAKLTKTRRTYATHRTATSFEVVPRIGAYIHIQGTPILGSHICDPSQFKFGATPPGDYWGRDKSKTYQGEEVPF